MKFGKRLKQQIQETLPGWRDKFLSYKELKKLVKMVPSASGGGGGGGGDSSSMEYAKAEAEFVCFLNTEIDKLNAFFMEQEEDFVIRHKELQQRIQEAIDTSGANPNGTEYKVAMAKMRKDIVDFHGEMVLLLNYSNINYTGLGKILKKYDKRTGGLLRLPFIEKVAQQPFFTTDPISKLIRDCEATIYAVFDTITSHGRGGGGGGEAMTSVAAGEGVFRNTVAALWSMQEMRKRSSTYSQFSLPPLHLPDDFDAVTHFLQLSASPIVPIP